VYGNILSWTVLIRPRSVSYVTQVLKQAEGQQKSLRSHLKSQHNINVLKGKHDDDVADLGSDDEGSSTSHVLHPKSNIHNNRKSASASGSSTMMKYILKPNDSSRSNCCAHDCTRWPTVSCVWHIDRHAEFICCCWVYWSSQIDQWQVD